MNWRNIRVYNNSQNNAFEELVCQLARQEKNNDFKRFIRNGTPDGGVECFWELQNGQKYAWQAKYIFDIESVIDQVNKSYNVALKSYPNMSKFIVAIPFDLPNPNYRKEGNKVIGALKKWENAVTLWEKKAERKTVSIVLWSASELLQKMLKPENEGMRYYWFSNEEFTSTWFRGQLENVINDLGVQSSQKCYVQSDISKKFEYLRRTSDVYSEIQNLRVAFVKAGRLLNEEIEKNMSNYQQEQRKMQMLIGDVSEKLQLKEYKEMKLLPFEEINVQLKKADEFNEEMKNIAYQELGKAFHESNYYRAHIEFKKAICKIQELLNSSGALLNTPALLLYGEANTGKSYLLADICRKIMDEGIPSVLILGNHFTGTINPREQIRQLFQSNLNYSSILGVLNAIGQAKEERIMFVLDALNEGEGNIIWPKFLRGMLAEIKRFPWIGFVVSIRSDNMDEIVPEECRSNMVSVQQKLDKDENTFEQSDNLLDDNIESVVNLMRNQKEISENFMLEKPKSKGMVTFKGKHFSITVPKHISILAFRERKIICLPGQFWTYFPTQLDYMEEEGFYNKEESIKTTFFVDEPDDYEFIVLMYIDSISKVSNIFECSMEKEKLVVKGQYSHVFSQETNGELPNELRQIVVNNECQNDNNPIEHDLTYDLERPCVIIDLETAEIVKFDVTKIEGTKLKGKIQLKINHPYFCFYITDLEDTENNVSDLEVARAYTSGTYGLDLNYFKAKYWYGKAASNGNAEAQYALGYLYEYGLGCVKSIANAIKYYELSASANNVNAQLRLGYLYEYGIGLDVNIRKAASLYRKAAKQGNYIAMLLLAYFYENGIGVGINQEKAVQWSQKCIKKHRVDDIFSLGMEFKSGEDYKVDLKKAVFLFRLASENGCIDAKIMLANCYIDGINLNKNYEKAFELLQEAAKSNSATGYNNLGWLYLNGYGIKENYSEARRCFEQAIALGNSMAYFHMGNFFFNGWETEQDYKNAMVYYEHASKDGIGAASKAIAEMYEVGKGVDRNIVLALKYYKLALDQGKDDVLEKIGELEYILEK